MDPLGTEPASEPAGPEGAPRPRRLVRRRTVRSIGVLAVTVQVFLTCTWMGAGAASAPFYPPTHPESAHRALPIDRVVWSWAGGVTARGVTVVAQLERPARYGRLLLQPVPDGRPVVTAALAVGADRILRLSTDDLRPATTYRYRIEIDGSPDAGRGTGLLRTMPASAASFTVAVGACARTGSNGAVFDAIASLRPAMYIQLGDLHYGNPARPSIPLFANLYRRVLTAPAQAALYREVPIAYLWDDHDYGPNDADASAPTRSAARAAYARYVPHYDLPAGPGGAIYQAFSIGRVRFLLTDTRSERTDRSMLGDRQRDWLLRELVDASAEHAVVVWVNPDPWVAPVDPTRDDWGAYADERQQIADVIARAGIRNLVMVAGDAHMVAIDDGTNTGYATEGQRGFPLLQAAALDRQGSVKGGPYSEGAFPGGGQFGTVTVTDTGGPAVEVELAGRNWRGEVLTAYRFTVPLP